MQPQPRKASNSQEKQATVRQQCKWEMELRPCSPRVNPGTPAHFRALPRTSAHSNPRASAHFRTLPHTSARIGCAHRHIRALPHTSAHFRALPHTLGARTDTPAHFRTLPHTSAHFRTLPRTSAHSRSDPLTLANMLRRLRCGTFAAGGILLSVFEDLEKMLGFTEIQRYSPNFRIRQILLKTFRFWLLSSCVQMGCFLSCVCPAARKFSECETCKKCWGKNVGDHCYQIEFLESISCDFQAEAGNPSIVSELHLQL